MAMTDGPRRRRRRLRAQLRQPAHPARGAARRLPEPAGQRRRGHRGRHGDQHGAAQPHRGRGGGAAPAREPGCHPRRPDGVRPRSRPADRRHDRRPRRHQRRLRDRPRLVQDARQGHGRAALGPRAPGSSSPNCPTSSGPRRSSRRSKTASTPRRSPASPTSPTSPTASTDCASSSASRPASAPTRVLEQLYRLTPLEDGFSINNVALVERHAADPRAARAAAGLPRPPHPRRHAAVAATG